MSTLPLPRFGLGCAPIGNLFRARSDDEAAAVLDAAWKVGVRHFDTAPHYGLGLSEERLGRFLATKPRHEFIVSTKVGRLIRANPDWDGSADDDQGFAVPARQRRILDYSADGVRISLEESLGRLGLDRVDIVYVHDPEVSGNPHAIQEGMDALANLRADGLVDAIGTGSLGVDALLTTVRTGLADLIMVAGRFTLLDQSVIPQVLDACTEFGTRIVAAAVFNSGLLATSPSKDATYNYAPAPADVLARARAIEEICTRHGVELAAAAVQYAALDARVASVIVGADSPDQVEQNLRRFTAEIPAGLWDELAERNLVPRCA